MMNEPILFMMMGLPASGKSTHIKMLNSNTPEKDSDIVPVLLSTDDYIEKLAAEQGKTYNEIFAELPRDEAEKHMYSVMREAISNKKNIVWDQTNLSHKIRKKKIEHFKNVCKELGVSYILSLTYFPIPDEEEWNKRLNSREGKVIPKHVLDNMIKSLEEPNKEDESLFDLVAVIKPNENVIAFKV